MDFAKNSPDKQLDMTPRLAVKLVGHSWKYNSVDRSQYIVRHLNHNCFGSFDHMLKMNILD